MANDADEGVERGYWKGKGLPYDREIAAMSQTQLAQELAKWENGTVPHRILSLEWDKRATPWHERTLAKFALPVLIAVVVAALLAWLGLKPK